MTTYKKTLENKPVRVYVNGKRQKNIHLHTTLFQRFAKILFGAVKISMLFLVVYGIFQAGKYLAPQSYIAQAQAESNTIIIDSLGEKIESLKWQYVHNIEKCESDNVQGLITFDPLVSNPSKTKKHDIASIGVMQFKQTTVIAYYKKLYNKNINMQEAALIALDNEKAEKLAYDIIFIEGGESNWLNCSRKNVDLLKTIKLLSK